RRLEKLVPVHQVRQERQRLGGQFVAPGAKDIGNSSFVNEHAHLGLAHGQRRAILDFEILHGVPVGQNPVCTLGPLDDINKLLLQEVFKGHSTASLHVSSD